MCLVIEWRNAGKQKEVTAHTRLLGQPSSAQSRTSTLCPLGLSHFLLATSVSWVVFCCIVHALSCECTCMLQLFRAFSVVIYVPMMLTQCRASIGQVSLSQVQIQFLLIWCVSRSVHLQTLLGVRQRRMGLT